MFDVLVRNIALYGAEVYGWKYDRLDRIKRKYAKWILGLDKVTPNYILLEGTKMKELRREALRRAVRYEETAWNSNKKIVIECIKEIRREKRRSEENKWERGRREIGKSKLE